MKGDVAGVEDFSFRLGHHGKSRAQSSVSTSNQSPNGSYRPYQHMTSGHNKSSPVMDRLPSTGRCKPLQAAGVMQKLLTSDDRLQDQSVLRSARDGFAASRSSWYFSIPLLSLTYDADKGGPEMPQNRHTVRANLTLSPDQAQRIKNDRSLRLLLYCGLTQGMSPHQTVEVAFPNQLEVKINDDDIRANFKGLKNKPGSTKPADITDRVRKSPGYHNHLIITYALTTKRYAFMVHMVRYVSPETLIQRIKSGRVIPKHKVIEEMSKANADSDVSATSIRMSLKDPISTVRITLPVRSTICKHNQCFDGAMFLQLQEQAPQWSCPVCNGRVSFDSLCVDKYFEDILQKTPHSIEKVDIQPNGEWTIIKEEDQSQSNNGSSRAARASYDDDFDDDLIEVTDVVARPTNGVSKTPSVVSPIATLDISGNSPPSSRAQSTTQSQPSAAQPQGKKRPASAVIDLTLSDEDEEPVRPMKRQSTSTHQGNPSHNHHTPTLPPKPRVSSQSSGHSHTDSYRPPSTSIHQSGSGSAGTADASASRYPSYNLGSGGPQINGHTPSSRPGSSGSPPYAATASVASQSPWSPSLNRTDGPRFPGFPIRPPSSASNGGTQSRQNESLRLPPIHSPPFNTFHPHHHVWRGSEHGNYSSSPPG